MNKTLIIAAAALMAACTTPLPAYFPLLGKCSNLIANKLSSARQFELGKMQAPVLKKNLNVRHKPEEHN